MQYRTIDKDVAAAAAEQRQAGQQAGQPPEVNV
jgi:hypothetical protein